MTLAPVAGDFAGFTPQMPGFGGIIDSYVGF